MRSWASTHRSLASAERAIRIPRVTVWPDRTVRFQRNFVASIEHPIEATAPEPAVGDKAERRLRRGKSRSTIGSWTMSSSTTAPRPRSLTTSSMSASRPRARAGACDGSSGSADQRERRDRGLRTARLLVAASSVRAACLRSPASWVAIATRRSREVPSGTVGGRVAWANTPPCRGASHTDMAVCASPTTRGTIGIVPSATENSPSDSASRSGDAVQAVDALRLGAHDREGGTRRCDARRRQARRVDKRSRSIDQHVGQLAVAAGKRAVATEGLLRVPMITSISFLRPSAVTRPRGPRHLGGAVMSSRLRFSEAEREQPRLADRERVKEAASELLSSEGWAR